MKNIFVDLNTAVHLGLLINEIICRSLEFRKLNKSLEFSYYMRKYNINEIEMYSIIIHDNWEYSHKHSSDKEDNELELIKVLSEQIDADLDIEETDVSTIYKIDFAVER
jgi:two-component sensor histidine kinase